MYKMLLWPFIAALVVLVIVVIAAKRGNGVRSAADTLQHLATNELLVRLLIALVVLTCVGGWLAYNAYDSTVMVLSTLLTFILAAAVVIVILVVMGVGVCFSAAPLAAHVGEQLNDEQKRAVWRHAMRWLKAFKNW